MERDEKNIGKRSELNGELGSLCSLLSFFCWQIIKRLLFAGADVNLNDEEEKLPLHLATELRSFFIFNFA